MSHRPLVFVSGLTVGDYLLWSWSLGGNHGVLALVSGLTLPPLTVLCLWLLALSLARLIAHTARRPGWRARRRPARQQRSSRRRRRSRGAAVSQAPAVAASTDTPPRKLAA